MKRNYILLIGGALNLLTAILHTYSGHIGHLTPVLNSLDLKLIDKTVLLAVWHMVSVVLFMSCYPALKKGFNTNDATYTIVVRSFGIMYILFGLVFILSSIHMNFHAAQWVLLAPIGILYLIGTRK